MRFDLNILGQNRDMDKLARMKELVSTLNEWARLYYEEDAPVVADAEYDRFTTNCARSKQKKAILCPTVPRTEWAALRRVSLNNPSIFCDFTALTSASRKRSFSNGATAS